MYCQPNQAGDVDYEYTIYLLLNKVHDLFFEGDYTLCADLSTWGEMLIHRYFPYKLDYVAYFVYYKARALFALKKISGGREAPRKRKNWHLAKLKNKEYVAGIYGLYGVFIQSKRGV